jgi:hypothetical protein
LEARFVVIPHNHSEPVAGDTWAVLVQVVDNAEELASRNPRLFKPFAGLKVHKHEIFFLLFAETETLWSQGTVTRDF